LIYGVQQVAIEFCTAALNPNFPPRTGLAKGLQNNDVGYEKRSWLSVGDPVSHETAGVPQDELDAFVGLYGEGNEGQGWERLAGWLNGAVQRWREDRLQRGDREVLQWMLEQGLLRNHASEGSELAGWVAEYRRVESEIPFARAVMSMDERSAPPVRYPLNVRGDVYTPGELISPAFLRMLGVGEVRDRRALAEALLDPEHPLTARVYVNRVWQWIFGTGLVATPDDFGRLGGRPSNPALLDWLAREFVREGWSTKKLVRRLVLSETFRRSGGGGDAVRERDPLNQRRSYYATRRLEAEAVRDSMLAVSGRLDARLYGSAILPHRQKEDGAKRLFSGPLDGEGRRSVYLQMSIMQPPAFLVTFNLPDLKLPTGRRDVTNVPTQALTLLNDPFVRAMARHWAEAEWRKGAMSVEQRLSGMFERAFGRRPGAEELSRWTGALEGLGGDGPAGWEAIAHAFFNAKEFLYYR
jgi:hypothetical protein